MSFASDLSAEALAVIATYGEPVTWRSIARTYSTSTASTVETVTEYAVNVAVQPAEEVYASVDTVGSNALVCYLPSLMPDGTALAFTPKLADRVEGVDGIEYTVTLVNTIRAQGVAIVYEVQLRA